MASVIRGVTIASALVFSAGSAVAIDPPANLVSFQWAANGSANPTAGASCEPGCANTSDCTTTGAPYGIAGAAMVQQYHQHQARRNCGGVCGGAGIALSVGQTDGVMSIANPFFDGQTLSWGWSDSIGTQASAGAGELCGRGFATGQAGGSASWDVVFDAVGGGGPGPGAALTLLTLGYSHQVGGNNPADGGNAASSFLLESVGGPALTADSIQVGFDGDIVHTAAPTFSLPPGRYHLQINQSCGAAFSAAAGTPSGNRGASASSSWNLRFDPYVCASITEGPQNTRSCAGETVSFTAATAGSALTHLWEWRPVDTANWTPIVNGVNVVSGVSVFSASGQGTPSVSLSPITSTQREVRLTVSNACNTAISGAATFITASADFNGDGDIGTDGDIEAFFACLGGNCCATCATADFNGDGDVGTDADIESFFRVLAGGAC